MTPGTTSAEPQKLLAYSRAAVEIDGALEALAGELESALRAFTSTCKEFNAHVEVQLADRLRKYAQRARAVDSEVADVAVAFLQADQGLIDLYATEDPASLDRHLEQLLAQGVSEEEVQRVRALVRLRQITFQQQLLEDLDPDQMLAEAEELDKAAQAALDQYYKSYSGADSIYSPLAPLDKQRIEFLLWARKLDAVERRKRAIALQIQQTELEKEQVELELSLAQNARPSSPEEAAFWRRTGEQAATIGSLQAQLAAVNTKLNGDTTIPGQIDKLKKDLAASRASGGTNNYNWDYQHNLEVKIKQLEEVEGGLYKDYADADQAVEDVKKNLEVARNGLQTEHKKYQQQILQVVPLEYQELVLLRRVAVANGWSDVVTRVDELMELLKSDDPMLTNDPAVFDAAYQRLLQTLQQSGPEADDRRYAWQQRLGDVFSSDPRLQIMDGQRAVGPDVLSIVLGNLILLGLPNIVENLRVLNAPVVSPEVRDEAVLWLAVDIGLLAFGGPLIKAGVKIVFRGGKYVVEISDKTLVALKLMYGPDIAALLQAAVTRVEQLMLRLPTMTPAELEQELMALIAQMSRGADRVGAAANLTARDIVKLRQAGYTVEELVQASVPLNALREAGISVDELLAVGARSSDLVATGTSIDDIIEAGQRLSESDWRRLIDDPPRGFTANDMRYQRYRQDKLLNDETPLDRPAWDSLAEQLEANRLRGRRDEDNALAALGVDNNNYNTTVTRTDRNGVGTRPDGITETHWVEVKSTRQPVQYLTEQIRRQFELAQADGKGLAVVITNTNEAAVRPSDPLAQVATVLHRNSETGDWHVWSRNLNRGQGGWYAIPAEKAADMISSIVR